MPGNTVSRALEAIKPVYADYWKAFTSIAPYSPSDVFSRYVFAFCTVNFGWQTSVELYTRLAGLSWPATERDIKSQFEITHSGFYNGRPAYMADFGRDFAAYPSDFIKDGNENWLEARQRIVSKILGLGRAKTAFAFEMIYPETSEVVCLDRHMVRNLFDGDATGLTDKDYWRLEKQWVDTCLERNLAPAIARLAYWDHIQGHDSPWYWACAFETDLKIKIRE